MIVVNARFLTQPITGVQRFAIELSKILKREMKNEVLFVTSKHVLNTDLQKELDAKIIGKNVGHIWEQIDLPKYLKSIGHPLLLSLANSSPILYKNKIVAVHDITFARFPKSSTKKFWYFYKILTPLVIRTSKHILTVSEFSKKEISNYYNVPMDKISVVYNAVTQGFVPEKNINFADEDYFMSISSAKQNKNLISLLESFKLLLQDYPHMQLRIVGNMATETKNDLDISKYSHIDNIKFFGRVDDKDLIKMYANAKAFIFPSLYEGFGIPPLEAQSCLCPVIVSNRSSLPEIFAESALYCNPTDIADLENKMKILLTDSELREKLIEAGNENCKRFSWEKSAHQIINILKKRK